MTRVQQYAACLVVALGVVMVLAGKASAAGIILNNEMDQNITGIYCVDSQGKTQPVTGALRAQSQSTALPDKFPEHECTRLAVSMENGSTWQFYHEPEPGAAKEIIFSQDRANPQADETYPSLLIDSSGESYVSPAGVPLFFLTQGMQFGMDEAKWKEAAAPNADSAKKLGEYAVSFADVSWSLAGDGLVFSELVPGLPPLAESARLVSPFSNATIMAIFEGLKGLGASPWALCFKNKESALTKEGQARLHQARLLPGMENAEKRWEAVFKLMEEVADSEGKDQPRLIFGSEDIIFELLLDLERGSASLSIVRRPDAAFG